MINNVALDVVIGLVFVYLLYSLLATVIAEIFATQIGLRAYNLKEAVDRMLRDEAAHEEGWWHRFRDSMKLRKNPDNPMVNNFYNHPEIKYLGSSGLFKAPSCFKAVSFSKTLMYALSGEGASDKTKIRDKLQKLIDPDANKITVEEKILDKEAAKYVMSLLDDSYDDLVKFKLLLENWFDRTMEQALEWYKRKIQFILVVLGFLLAWFFNADTFTIVNKLSTDKDAREKMVQLAASYNQNNGRPEIVREAKSGDSAKANTLINEQLKKDIASANSILGTGCWPPDNAVVMKDPSTGEKYYLPALDYYSLSKDQKKEEKTVDFHCADKLWYLFRLLLHHALGYFVTAIAVSLGAPFWFDLLNRIMKLRTSVKQPNDTSETAQNADQSLLMREA